MIPLTAAGVVRTQPNAHYIPRLGSAYAQIASGRFAGCASSCPSAGLFQQAEFADCREAFAGSALQQEMRGSNRHHFDALRHPAEGL